jgi:hypothetical protein
VGAAAAFHVGLLAAPTGAIEQVAAMLRFRNAMADEFSGLLRKSQGKTNSISFDMRVTPAEVEHLYSWPEVQAVCPRVVVSLRAAGHHRISYVVTDTTIQTPTLIKELLEVILPCPDPLFGFLGK